MMMMMMINDDDYDYEVDDFLDLMFKPFAALPYNGLGRSFSAHFLAGCSST